MWGQPKFPPQFPVEKKATVGASFTRGMNVKNQSDFVVSVENCLLFFDELHHGI